MMSHDKSYFNLVPSDLLPQLFLYFNSNELLPILPQLKTMPDLYRVVKSTVFWNKLWTRDISSIVPVPIDPYQKYVEIYRLLPELPIKQREIAYLANNGYNILLLPLLSNKSEYKIAMVNAASGGHIEIVKSMLQKGADNYNGTMKNAAHNGHIQIVELMLNSGAVDYNYAMASAAAGGYMEIVELMLQKGANDYNGGITAATNYNYQNIVDLIKSYQ